MKKLLLILSLFSVISYAEEVKLTCQANYTMNINGVLEKSLDGNLEVTVIQTLDKLYRAIVTSGLVDLSAGTVPTDRHYDSIDLSNENRWLLSSKYRDESFSDLQTIIQINRNTGAINITQTATAKDKNKSIALQKLNGICSKIDTSKRKF
jgi:hypothetical protein